MKKKALVGEPKPKGRPQKNPIEIYIKISVDPVIIEGEEVALSITKTTSKIYKPGLYNKVINDPIYSHH